MRPALAIPALLALAGCAHDGEPRVPNSMLVRSNRMSSSAPEGPRALRASPFDYAALPELTEGPVGDDESATLAFRPGKGGPELYMTGALVAEVEVGSPPPPEVPGADIGTRPRARSSGHYYHVFRGWDGTGPFAWTPAHGSGDLCGREAPAARARWQGYTHEGRTSKGLAFVCYEGTFDTKTCSVRAERSWRVTARPVVPDTLYAFRAPDGACSPPTPSRSEKLVVVGPRPLWLSSTAPLFFQGTDGPRSFSRVVVPVSPAHAASVVVDARPEDVRMFRGVAESDGNFTPFSYSVEVVWGPSDPEPTGIAFVSALSGNTGAMTSDMLHQIRR